MSVVKIKENAVEIYCELFGGEFKTDASAVAFIESIAGKEIELVYTGVDAFEKNDNNYWIPKELIERTAQE